MSISNRSFVVSEIIGGVFVCHTVFMPKRFKIAKW